MGLADFVKKAVTLINTGIQSAYVVVFVRTGVACPMVVIERTQFISGFFQTTDVTSCLQGSTGILPFAWRFRHPSLIVKLGLKHGKCQEIVRIVIIGFGYGGRIRVYDILRIAE